MIATQTAVIHSQQPKRKHQQRVKKQETVQETVSNLTLVRTPETGRAYGLLVKQEFFERKLELSEKLIRNFFGPDSYRLLSHYFLQELQERQTRVGEPDESEWNDDPTGCTPDEYGLKLAKKWREDFFKSGLPVEDEYINIFYYEFGRKCNAATKLLKYYMEKEITEGAVKHNWQIEKIEYEYVG